MAAPGPEDKINIDESTTILIGENTSATPGPPLIFNEGNTVNEALRKLATVFVAFLGANNEANKNVFRSALQDLIDRDNETGKWIHKRMNDVDSRMAVLRPHIDRYDLHGLVTGSYRKGDGLHAMKLQFFNFFRDLAYEMYRAPSIEQGHGKYMSIKEKYQRRSFVVDMQEEFVENHWDRTCSHLGSSKGRQENSLKNAAKYWAFALMMSDSE